MYHKTMKKTNLLRWSARSAPSSAVVCRTFPLTRCLGAAHAAVAPPLRVITIGRKLVSDYKDGAVEAPRFALRLYQEFGFGKRPNVKAKQRPPLVPLYPKHKAGLNMDLMLRYRDLKMRWRHKGRVLRMYIKRKRRLRLSWLPEPRPTCSFISHDRMPHSTKQGEMPTLERLDTRNAFAIVKTSVDKQHKVTRGDLVMTHGLRRKQAGDKVVFGTVLLVGSPDWTIIGKPTVPYARVVGTIEQQTVTKDHISFSYRTGSRWSRFKRSRNLVAIIHIDGIVVDPYTKPDITPPRPVRLLDLWANRWLDPDEMAGVRYREDGITPVVEEIYDGREPRSNLFHDRGLTDCYRFAPDPLSVTPELFAEQHHRMQATTE